MRSPLGALATVLNRTPVPYTTTGPRLNILAPLRHNAVAQMEAMSAVGTLFAIINRISTGVAQVNWRLYRKARSGDPEDRTEVPAHAALDVWRKANKFMPGQEFVETFQQHVDLTGEAWWIIGRHPKVKTLPLELWPVRPDRMEPVPDPVDFIRGYVYTGPGGEKVPLDVTDVICLKMPNPMDPYRGLGPVQAALVDIESSALAAQWNRNFFRNSAEPGGLMEVEKRLSDDEFDELRDRWAEQHRGVANAHRVAILEQGAKWVDRKYTNRDMQFTELRTLGSEMIREAFGFPKAMLGTDVANRALAEAQEVVFSRWLLVPRLDRIKGALNHELLPMFPGGEGLEFDYDDPTPMDHEAENARLTAASSAAVALVNAGWDDVAVLETVGLPVMPFKAPAPPAPLVLPPAAGDDEPPVDQQAEARAVERILAHVDPARAGSRPFARR